MMLSRPLLLIIALGGLSACGGDLSSMENKNTNENPVAPTQKPEALNEPNMKNPDPAPAEEPPPVECKSAGEVCLKLRVPAELTEDVTKISTVFYKSLPPGGFPDLIVRDSTLLTPDVTAGELFWIKLTEIDQTGTFYPFVALYMPGGGSWQPKVGVDYVGLGPAIEFADKGVTVEEEITFTMAE